MLRFFGSVVLILFFIQALSSQEVTGFHSVQLEGEPRFYSVKTNIGGLKVGDVGQIKYLVDSTHLHIPLSSNALHFDRSDSFIKFYVTVIPPSGEINVELGIQVSNGGEYAFQVEFQYSRNEKTTTIHLPRVYLTSDAELELEEVVGVDETLKEAAEQKVKEEAEAIQIVEQLKAKELSEQKAAEALSLKEAAEQKIKEEAEALRIVEQLKAKELEARIKAVESSPDSIQLIQVASKYTVQLLLLSNFSKERLKTYCNKHKLSIDEVIKNQVGGLTKITYGSVNSVQEARQVQEELRREHAVTDSFITKVK